jgi:hypothetical protein
MRFHLSSHPEANDTWEDYFHLDEESSALALQRQACLLNVGGALLTSIAVILISLKNGLEFCPETYRACNAPLCFLVGCLIGLLSVFLGCLAIFYDEDHRASLAIGAVRNGKWWRWSSALMAIAFAMFLISGAYAALILWEALLPAYSIA